MKGYCGKILRVDLSAGKISTELPSDDFFKRYLGGRGFIISILLRELDKGIDPLGSENKLIFALGPLTGHPLPGSGRNSIGSKSPLTSGFGEAEAGGFWGAELRMGVFEAIIVEGISEDPVYIFIDNGKAEIRDARHLWGLEVPQTESSLRDEIGSKKTRVAMIGPGGEKLVRFACILNDVGHVAGRTGLGAVMGSKKLKAIAVKGNRPPEMANREKIIELSRWMGANFKQLAPWWKYGTGAGTTMKHYEMTGNLPIRNFQGGRFPAVDKITAQTMREKGYVEKMGTCFVCPVRCKKIIRSIKYKNYGISAGPGPEYETLAALGSNCGIDSLEAIIKANELCTRHGIDTISTGVTLSFAMECFEAGIIDRQMTDGLELTFGNAEAMVAMVERIALRKGFGNILAEGVKRAAAKIGRGSAEYAMHVKGEEIPMHEPRYKKGMGLHYGVHVTGADHCTGIHDDSDSKNLSRRECLDVADEIPTNELSPRKARMLYQMGLWRQAGNYLGLCQLVPWSYNQIRDALEAVTGWPMSHWRIMKSVERGITLARIFNQREGRSDDDDNLPGRFNQAPADGPLQEERIDPDRFSQSRKAYYQMMGWTESGIPTYGRLAELGLEWAAKYMEDG